MSTESLPSRRCWITGAGGLIGNALSLSPWIPSGWQAVPQFRSQLELTDFAAVSRAFLEPPDAVIHCAALSQSPACQANPKEAWKVNVEATRHLAALAADRQIPFFFFSTDLVFDGQKGWYTEMDRVNPLSIYGETKIAAEGFVLANPRHTVVRTSLNHGTSPSGQRAFNEELLNAWRAGRTTRLFVDEFRCPIRADVTARATWELLNCGASGLFHLAGSERLSRLEIGEYLSRQHPEIPARIERSSLREYQGAPRAPDTSLDCSKAQALLSFPLPQYRVPN